MFALLIVLLLVAFIYFQNPQAFTEELVLPLDLDPEYMASRRGAATPGRDTTFASYVPRDGAESEFADFMMLGSRGKSPISTWPPRTSPPLI